MSDCSTHVGGCQPRPPATGFIKSEAYCFGLINGPSIFQSMKGVVIQDVLFMIEQIDDDVTLIDARALESYLKNVPETQ